MSSDRGRVFWDSQGFQTNENAADIFDLVDKSALLLQSGHFDVKWRHRVNGFLLDF